MKKTTILTALLFLVATTNAGYCYCSGSSNDPMYQSCMMQEQQLQVQQQQLQLQQQQLQQQRWQQYQQQSQQLHNEIWRNQYNGYNNYRGY